MITKKITIHIYTHYFDLVIINLSEAQSDTLIMKKLDSGTAYSFTKTDKIYNR